MRTSRVLPLAASFITLGLAIGCGGVDATPGTGGTGTGGTTSSTGDATSTSTGNTGGASTASSSSSTASASSSASSGTGGAFVAACTASEGTVLGITHLFLGDKNPDGTTDANAWKQYGFNVDNKVSTAAST